MKSKDVRVIAPRYYELVVTDRFLKQCLGISDKDAIDSVQLNYDHDDRAGITHHLFMVKKEKRRKVLLNLDVKAGTALRR